MLLVAILMNLEGLSSVDTTGGDLVVYNNDTLVGLTGLDNINIVGGNLSILFNDDLNSLVGLEGLTTIGRNLEIIGNDNLLDLTSLSGLSNFGNVFSSTLDVNRNMLLQSLAGLENIDDTTIDSLAIHSNPVLSVCDRPNICAYLNNGGINDIYGNATNCNSNLEVINDCLYPCTAINLKVIIEGAYDVAVNEMTTSLSVLRRLLPGQTPANPLIQPTPPGQPYSIAPWNYSGTEGLTFTDASYPDDVVDWVLVSLRTDIYKANEVGQTAALLLKDGTVATLSPCPIQTTETGPFYIVVEHRNHMGIMSPVPIAINDGEINYDFTIQDSYKDATSVGQKPMISGAWTMFAGDINQSVDINSYDISGQDKTVWGNDNGLFDQYLPSDINLDGNTTGADKILWEENNGISSRVPK